jgi:hypothetical protein
MRANDTRLMLLMARDLMTGRQSGLESLRHLRRWMLWEGKEEYARLIKYFETLGTEAHGELRRAFSTGQIESKLWLIDMLSSVIPRDREYKITVIGGWLGVLPYLMHQMHPELVASVQQLDLNPETNRMAEALNAPLALNFTALDKDALEHDYDDQPEIIINTSCEHFTAQEIKLWLQRLPAGRIVVLQSNNFFNEPGHVNCHRSVFAFRKSLDLQTYLYTGEMEFEKYTRFMVIGTTHGAF